MYPNTTSLYPATVIDNSTHFREDEQMIVVEFDGDEDELMKVPQRHIPSRFVTPIPVGFDTSKKGNQKNSSDGKLKQAQTARSSFHQAVSKPSLPSFTRPKKDSIQLANTSESITGQQNNEILELSGGKFEW